MQRKLILFTLLAIVFVGIAGCASAAKTETVTVNKILVATAPKITATATAPVTVSAATTQPSTSVPTSEVPFFPSTWQGALPILTSDNQGMTFGPGQAIVAFAEGLMPDSAVTISWMHEIQGIIASISGSTDSSGQSVVNHVVRDSLNQPGARPAGSSQLTFEDQNGTKQTYAFAIDYGKTVEMTPAQCGVYPAEIHPDNGFAVWCGGNQQAVDTQTLPVVHLLVDGEPYAEVSDGYLGDDGLYLLLAQIDQTEPIGIWTFQIGEQSVSMRVTAP